MYYEISILINDTNFIRNYQSINLIIVIVYRLSILITSLIFLITIIFLTAFNQISNECCERKYFSVVPIEQFVPIEQVMF